MAFRFLFASLHISNLSREISVSGVKHKLMTLPEEIEMTYKDEMNRIARQKKAERELAQRAMAYIFGATRSLSKEELCHALAVETGNPELNEDAIPEIETLLMVSFDLIQLDQAANTVRLVHQTFYDFLEKNPGIIRPAFEDSLAQVCLTYISFDVFASGACSNGELLLHRLQAYCFLDYASHYWGHHFARSQCRMDSVVAFLQDDKKISAFVQVLHLASHRTGDWQNHYPKNFGPLHVLAYWGLVRLLDVFAKPGTDFNQRDSYGETPFQIAAGRGHESFVQRLLQKDAVVNTENNSGITPLSLAAKNGHKGVVELLLAKGANVLTRDCEGWNAIDVAVIEGKKDVARALLDHGISTRANDRHNALYWAANEGHKETVQMLLEDGADVNGQDWVGSTALDWAAPGGHAEIVQILLHKGADLSLTDKYQNTALHWSIQHAEIMGMLLDKGADVNAKNDTGQTALCWTARDGSVEVAQLLINTAADIDAQDKFGCTALHGACLKGRGDMAQLLLENGADSNAKDRNGWTPLHLAAFSGCLDIVQLLIAKTDDGPSIMQWIALQQKDAKACALIQQILEEQTVGSTLLTGLRVAVTERHFSRLRLLLDKGADINAKDPGGWTALTLAAENGYTDAVQELLQRGADVHMNGGEGWPALYWACQKEEVAVADLLIAYGANVNISKHGWTPLHLAAKKGYWAIAKSLVENGGRVDTEDYRGQQALHLAAEYGHKDILYMLIENGADVNAVDIWGRTALMWAIENLQAEAYLLLDVKANVNVKASDGSTALHLAVVKQDITMTRQLLRHGAGTEAKTKENLTALHLAAALGFADAVRLLLTNGADVEAQAQWPQNADDPESKGDALRTVGLDTLGHRLRRLFLEQNIILSHQNEDWQMFTAQQLARAGRYIEVEQILEEWKPGMRR